MPDPFSLYTNSGFVDLHDASPQQIVASAHHQGGNPLRDASQDVQDFDRDVDASFNYPSTIDPAILLSWGLPQDIPIIPSLPTTSDSASTASSASTWHLSEASSPPTSPEGLNDDDASLEDDSVKPGLEQLTEEQLQDLVRIICGNSIVAQANASTHDPGTHQLVPHPHAAAPVHQYPPVNAHYQHSRQQHFGDDVADADGQGAGVQVNAFSSGYPTAEANRLPPSAEDTMDTYANPTGIRPALAKPAPYKCPKATHIGTVATKKPKEKPKKALPCTVMGCTQVFDRSFNLREHILKKHEKQRPWKCDVEGCLKATEGYCRKSDLRTHMNKKHPGRPTPDVQTTGTQTPALWAQGAPPAQGAAGK